MLAGLPEALRARQPVFDRTGGVHAAALATPDGELLVVREDVGRHNAVDKVVGAVARERELPFAGTVLVVSARASFEIVQKASVAGIPVVVAVGAATRSRSSWRRRPASRSSLSPGPRDLSVYSRPDRLLGPASDQTAGYRPVAVTRLGERRRSGERWVESAPSRARPVIGERTSAWPPAKTSAPSSTASRRTCRTSTPPRPRSGSTASTRSSTAPAGCVPATSCCACSSARGPSRSGVPSLTTTDYVNTISPEQEPWFPGDEEVERRFRAYLRWNAAMIVHRAQRPGIGVGGHISTYASAATLYEVGFNHFFRGKDHPGGGDQVFFQGHASPGMYARAFLEGRLSEDRLDGFRQEKSHVVDGSPLALPSYPHPRLMPDFWEFPTVSMGIGPMNAIYQAQFNKYLHNRGIKDTSEQHVWAFLGDGEMDEPESRGLLQLAAGEELDNLTFVVNCNLQRLDGPVRGNGKIIQELEAFFRGAGWNVIKVVWGRGWDPLLASDGDGALVHLMNTTSDGDYQTFRANDGKHVRDYFFDRDPRTRKMVADWSDDDIWWKLKRGGHDYRKVYAAYQAAIDHTGQPTVILAKTIKGYGLGQPFAGRNATHQMKKFTLDDLKTFRDSLQLPISDEALEKRPVQRALLPPGPRRRGHPVRPRAPREAGRRCAAAAHRSTPRCTCPTTRPTPRSRRARASSRSPRRWRSSACSRTSCATRSSASGSCRSSPTRRAPSGWTASSRRSRSTTRTARTTRRSTPS